MKKIVSIALALLLLVAMVPMAVFAETTPVATGEANEDVEYIEVDDESDFTDPDGNYKLVSDITISTKLFSGKTFTGTVIGDGHTVKLNATSIYYMFATEVGGDAYFENFVIESVRVSYAANWNGGGRLCIKATGGTFVNVTAKTDFTCGQAFGSLIGRIENPTHPVTFKDCVTSCNISYTGGETGTQGMYFGGLVGTIESNTQQEIKFINCVNKGAISGRDHIGGLVGSIYNISGNVTFIDCKNEGELTSGGSNFGALVGSVDESIVCTSKTEEKAVYSSAHDFANGTCKNCGVADPNYVAPNPPAGGNDPVTPPSGGNDPVTPPTTSDITVFVLAIAVVALAGVCVVSKKIKE